MKFRTIINSVITIVAVSLIFQESSVITSVKDNHDQYHEVMATDLKNRKISKKQTQKQAKKNIAEIKSDQKKIVKRSKYPILPIRYLVADPTHLTATEKSALLKLYQNKYKIYRNKKYSIADNGDIVETTIKDNADFKSDKKEQEEDKDTQSSSSENKSDEKGNKQIISKTIVSGINTVKDFPTLPPAITVNQIPLTKDVRNILLKELRQLNPTQAKITVNKYGSAVFMFSRNHIISVGQNTLINIDNSDNNISKNSSKNNSRSTSSSDINSDKNNSNKNSFANDKSDFKSSNSNNKKNKKKNKSKSDHKISNKKEDKKKKNKLSASDIKNRNKNIRRNNYDNNDQPTSDSNFSKKKSAKDRLVDFLLLIFIPALIVAVVVMSIKAYKAAKDYNR